MSSALSRMRPLPGLVEESSSSLADFGFAAIYLGCGQALSCSRRAVTGAWLGEKELQE